MASSSSTQKHHGHHLLNNLYSGGATSAPPPTPSSQPSSSSSDAAADTLSRLLHRLPPSLSLPTRLSPRASNLGSSSLSPLPTVSLSPTSSFELGYFQLKTHSIAPQLAEDAELEASSLFELTLEERVSLFPKDWPLGFNYDDDDDDLQTGSFCLDGACSTTCDSTGDATKLKLASLRKLTSELEKLGLEVVEKLACTVGFANPFKEGGVGVGPKHCSLMWVSSSEGMRVYPYVVGLQYQIRPRKWDLLSDVGSVIVEPQVGSVLVTLGDLAQVWSNGKIKKVRGRAAPIISEDNKSSRSISMTLLLSLPLESTVCVSPLINTSLDLNNRQINKEAGKYKEECHENNNDTIQIEEDDDDDDHRVFNSFSFEDYAWRVYHERLRIKDPLDRFRVIQY